MKLPERMTERKLKTLTKDTDQNSERSRLKKRLLFSFSRAAISRPLRLELS